MEHRYFRNIAVWAAVTLIGWSSMAGANETYVDANGIRFHCLTGGHRGELVMFLHGFPEFSYEWKDQLREFGKDHRVVAPDLRRYNLSDKPTALAAYRV